MPKEPDLIGEGWGRMCHNRGEILQLRSGDVFCLSSRLCKVFVLVGNSICNNFMSKYQNNDRRKHLLDFSLGP